MPVPRVEALRRSNRNTGGTMARKASALVNWSQYLPLRIMAGLLQCFSPGQNLHTAAGIGTLLYRSNRKRRARTHENLRLSFPEWDEANVRETAERSYQSMVQLAMVDALIMTRMITPDTWASYVQVKDVQPVLEVLDEGKPLLMLTGHCGNWEMLAYTLSVIGFPITGLARPLDNPLINKWLLDIRQAHGLQVLTKWGATRELQRSIESGRHLGFIADQNAGDQGLFVPFFGRLASSYKSIGLLAMRYETPIAIAQARRIGHQFKYEFICRDVIRPEDWADQEDPLFYITARYNHALEQLIREAPEQYLWLHRRWKSRPRFEKEGQPIPTAMVDKIAALPWMTDQELERIINASNHPAQCTGPIT
jgi:KDO2-lipid IV(A) lauroyltransferase